MNNGSSYNRNKSQNGKSYRGYYGNKPADPNAYKKNYVNRFQRPTHDQARNTYYNAPANEGSRYQQQAYPQSQPYSQRTPPAKPRNVIDGLLADVATSIFFDVFARYHKLYKKQFVRGALSESDFVKKFEEVKKTYLSNAKLDAEMKHKLGANQEKMKLDKLQYDISAVHLENIENIKILEGKVVDDINLMQSGI